MECFTYFDVETVDDIPTLEEENEPHAVGDTADAHILLACARYVDQEPEDQAGPELVERLDIE
jgi:hypothetical protein